MSKELHAAAVQARAALASFAKSATIKRQHPKRHAKGLAALEALTAALAADLAEAEELEPVYGDLLPPVGSRVYILHGRDKDAHACLVTGYYAWGNLGSDKHLNRVFVRLVYEGTKTTNARLLSECYASEALALAARDGQSPC